MRFPPRSAISEKTKHTKVSLHSDGLHEDDANEGEDRGFLRQSRQLIQGKFRPQSCDESNAYLEHLLVIVLSDGVHISDLQVRSSCGDEVLIAFDRPSRLVMEMMGVAPSEVRNEEESV